MESLFDPLDAISRAGESKPTLLERAEHLVEVRRGLRVCMIRSLGHRAMRANDDRRMATCGNKS
jgi:hypothetical protein